MAINLIVLINHVHYSYFISVITISSRDNPSIRLSTSSDNNVYLTGVHVITLVYDGLPLKESPYRVQVNTKHVRVSNIDDVAYLGKKSMFQSLYPYHLYSGIPKFAFSKILDCIIFKGLLF